MKKQKGQSAWIIGLLFSIALATFAVMNVRPVYVDLIFYGTQLPLVIVILGSALLGTIVTGSFAWFRKLQARKYVEQLHEQIEALNVQLEQERLRVVRQDEVIENESPSALKQGTTHDVVVVEQDERTK